MIKDSGKIRLLSLLSLFKNKLHKHQSEFIMEKRINIWAVVNRIPSWEKCLNPPIRVLFNFIFIDYFLYN